jgi:hypothetical protein
MKETKILFAILILVLPRLANAQKVKLITSSGTNWSGGIAGRYGTGYNFTVEFSHYAKDEPMPDIIWLENKPVPIIIKGTTSPQHPNFNTTRTEGKKRVTYTFYVGTSHGDEQPYNNPYPSGKGAKTIIKPQPPQKYGGVALVSYRYKGGQKYFVIDKVLTRNPPVNYP